MRSLLSKYRNREDGFTLIELLIVVLIIGVLAAIAIPVYLGIQGQAHKSAVKADVNSQVASVQVALTEGANIASQYGTTVGSDKGSTVTIAASTTTGAGSKDFTVAGAESTTVANSSGDKGAVDYTYTYDSVTGQFTEGDGSIVLGGGSGTAPSFTTTSLPNGVVGTTYNQTIVVTGSPTPILSKTAGTLPPGVTFTAATGNLSGTPTTTGSYTFTIKAQNSSGAPTQSYTIVVTQAPTFTTTSLPNGTVGTAYNQTIVASGTPAPTYSLDSGTLPAGLTLDQNSGALAGNPTTANTYNFTIKATNSAGNTTQSYTVTIAAAVNLGTVTITTTSLPDAYRNAAYAGAQITSTQTGDSGTVTYAATGLPTGLSMTSGGYISGTATAASNTYTVSVTATKTVGSSGSVTDNKNIALKVTTGLSFDFETDTGAWYMQSAQGTLSRSTVRAHGGAASMQVTTAAGGTTAEYDLTNKLTVGKSYTLTGWVYTSAASNGGLRIRDAAGNTAPAVASPASGAANNGATTNAWVQVTVTFTYASGQVLRATTSSATVNFDDITIVEN